MQPRIIPRQTHGISRKQLSHNALRILYRLHDHGFIAYLVGGCVRDLLIGREPKDFDIATNAVPGQIKRLFRNCRLVGRRFRLAHLHFQNEMIEVATFRAAAPLEESEEESVQTSHQHLKDESGMLLRDNIFGAPEEDALRRDFTINALAYNIADFTVIDYTSGLQDLKQRIIRPIGDPYERFTEDPVRMLRAVRFAAMLDFSIEQTTMEAIRSCSATIVRAAPARLYEEVLKLFLMGSARPILDMMDENGLFGSLFNEYHKWLKTAPQSRLTPLCKTLDIIDNKVSIGATPSPPLFFAAFFGYYLEEAALARHLKGMPHSQALDEAVARLLEGVCRTVRIPARVVIGIRNIIALQPTLRKIPPRKPHSIASRFGFSDSLEYMRIHAEITGEDKAAYEWWDKFKTENSLELTSAIQDERPARIKRPRRRRRRHHSVE